jgi:site-specific DNA-methyltransferase (adenine-specific)
VVKLNTIYQGDCLEILKTFDEKTVDCVITSPPYWQLRDYGWTGQWGLEKTYQEYLEHLWMMMDEIWRVLKDTGTVWINLGDSYYGSGHGAWSKYDNGEISHKDEYYGDGRNASPVTDWDYKSMRAKTLMLIPHRFAIGCIDRGWILRNDIIWAKRNGMPESVRDRFSKKHEFIFFFVKQQKYYFDLDGVRDKNNNWEKDYQRVMADYNGGGKKHEQGGTTSFKSKDLEGIKARLQSGKNPGDVSDFWDVPTQSSSEKHYATYNFDLIDKPIIAGCPEGGIVLDPFAGTGTTLLRAIDLRRKGIGIEGKKEYCDMFDEKFTERYGMLRDII